MTRPPTDTDDRSIEEMDPVESRTMGIGAWGVFFVIGLVIAAAVAYSAGWF